jgi:hypothetical protein
MSDQIRPRDEIVRTLIKCGVSTILFVAIVVAVGSLEASGLDLLSFELSLLLVGPFAILATYYLPPRLLTISARASFVAGSFFLILALIMVSMPLKLEAPRRETASAFPRPPPTPTGAYWNTWFEYLDEPVLAELTVGNVYTFVLDLSPYAYAKLWASQVQSTDIDPSVERAISDPRRKQLTFRVRPLLPEGGGLSFGPSFSAETVPLKAELEQIRNPNVTEARKYAAGATSLHDLSNKVAAGNLRFEVRTEAAGCSAVVLSILSEDGRFPLDHLVRWVAIGRPGETPPDCGAQTSGGRQQFRGGLGTLLEVSIEADVARTSQSAAAAFHIFDTRAGSFVVFSDGRPNQKRSVYAWQTMDSLVRYAEEKSRLPRLIDSARAAAVAGKPASYVTAAQELAAVLFTGKGADADEANLAKGAFQEIVEQSATRPNVIVRVVSDVQQAQNRSVFLPLGILSAKGEGAVLKQPITVIQPLPRERYASKTACIRDWTFGFPKKLEGISEDLESLKPKISYGTWFDDLAGLRSYLADTSTAKNAPAQGFLLLAHQGSGNLWFEDEAQRVIRQNITRNYPPGSVGVFAACSFAASSYDSGFVQRFNERGVDAIIASPFSVPATYGTRLAAEFPQALEDLRQAGRRAPTISDLFAVALDRTSRRLKQDFHGDYEEMGLEYVLLGDPNILLCGKISTEGSP